MTDKVAAAMAVVSQHMDQIVKLFRPGARITVLVRRPDDPEGDFLMTDDDFDEVKAALDRSKSRESV